MDLDFSDEQRMLAEAAGAFAMRSGDADVWPAMAALGWAGLPSLGDLVVLCEALGRGAVNSPVIASTVAARSITWAGNAEQQARWLPRLESAEAVFLGLGAATDEWDQRGMAGLSRLTGTKLLVPWAAIAEVIVVVTAGGLYVVEPRAGGVVCRSHHGIGDDPLFAVELQDAPAERLGDGDDHDAVVHRALDWASISRLADAVGAASRALELTVQYAKDRRQFGRPIGSFQAVAHRCVDMRTDLDACRYLAYQAAWALDRDESAELEVAAAKAYGNDALRRIFGHAHQVHGAIGFSTEHDLHLFTRRAKAFELTYGSTDHHLDRVATAIGLG